MAYIEVRVINSLAKFEGRMEMNDANATLQEVKQIVETLSENINSINRLGIVHEGGAITTFNKEILQQSVITLRAAE